MNSTIKGVLIFLAGLGTGVGLSYIFSHKLEMVEVEEKKEEPKKEENFDFEPNLPDYSSTLSGLKNGFGKVTYQADKPSIIPELPVEPIEKKEPEMESGEITGMKLLYYDPDLDELTDEFLDPVDLEPGAENYIREHVMEAGNIWLHTTDADDYKEVSFNGVDYKILFTAGSSWDEEDY